MSPISSIGANRRVSRHWIAHPADELGFSAIKESLEGFEVQILVDAPMLVTLHSKR